MFKCFLAFAGLGLQAGGKTVLLSLPRCGHTGAVFSAARKEGRAIMDPSNKWRPVRQVKLPGIYVKLDEQKLQSTGA